MIDVNLGAALWLTQAVAPYLRERGWIHLQNGDCNV
jgi:NAD(P)-dependent dehydrogenase (short-subunit alcohol dehydrogenase family)